MTRSETGSARLIGRDRELRALTDLLERARLGRGGAITYRGEPGMGKTCLLDALRAATNDALVLRCVGVEWEADFPYSGLYQLLRPLLGRLDELPSPQRRALEAALGLSDLAGEVQAGNVIGGALALILAAADDQPVLLLVDDLQWVDEPTRQVLSFIKRQAGEERVALISATRSPAPLGWSDVQDLAPLDADTIADLAHEVLGRSLPAAALVELNEATGGNPLAIVESLRRFGDQIVLRGSPLDAPLPVGELIQAAFAERLESLTTDVTYGLELAAISFTDDAGTLVDGLAELGLGTQTLIVAEAAGVLEFEHGRFAFTHPLLRALVHDRTPADRRRRCHAILAASSSIDPDLRVWHAAKAAMETDAAIAGALEDAGQRFINRGGYLAAAQAWERAGQLSPQPLERAERLLRAAEAAHHAGRTTWALRLKDQAADVAPTEVLRLRAEYLGLNLRAHLEPVANLPELYERLADRAAGLDPVLVADALCSATVDAIVASQSALLPSLIRRLRRVEDASLTDWMREEIASCLGIALLRLGGEEAIEGRDHLAASARRRLQRAYPRQAYVCEGLVWAEEWELAEALIDASLERARLEADTSTLLGVLSVDVIFSLRIGDWDRAAVSVATAYEHRDADQVAAYAWCRVVSALLFALRGEQDGLKQAVGFVQATVENGYVEAQLFGDASQGLAALGRGEAAVAIEHLGRAARHLSGTQYPDPNPLSWPLDLVEAHVLLGDLSAAEAALADLRTMAQASLRSWLHAAVPFAEGMLADDASFEGSLLVAIQAFDGARAPFERARAQLWLGRRLQRVGRGAEARGPLEAALSEFERLGAEPWARQVQRELGTSERLPRRRRRAADDPNELTPQERQVAALVASGATNKEAAGELFLSPKTVESHLSRIYRKLGVTSRTQLAARWNDGTGPRDEG